MRHGQLTINTQAKLYEELL